MKTFCIALLTFVCMISVAFAQPEVDWVQNYGGVDAQFGESFVITDDGGFAIAGKNNGGNPQFWMVRINGEAQQLWAHIYEIEGESNECYDLVQTDDGGFILVGLMTEGNENSWLVLRIDQEGNEIWRNEYFPDGGNMNYAEAVVALKDDQFVIAGGTSFGNSDGAAIKIDGNGEVLWQQEYGDDQRQHLFDIVTAPGGYAMCGYSDVDESLDAWLIRINDEDGEITWQQTYGMEDVIERAFALVRTEDNGFALTGYRVSGGEEGWDYYLIRTDEDGNVNWQNTYDINNRDIAYAIVEEIDGGFTIAGQQDVGQWYCGHSINVDRGGNLSWDFAEGEPFAFTSFTDAKIYPEDNSVIFCGTTYIQNVQVMIDAMLVKMTPVNHPPEIVSHVPPDSIVFILQGQPGEFSVEAIDIDGDELFYLWTMEEEVFGEEEVVIIPFDEAGDFELTCTVSDWEFSDSTQWLVHVMTLIAGHTPEVRELTVPLDTTITFEINAGIHPDSLQFLWMIGEDNIGIDTTTEITFPELGLYEVTAFAMTELYRDSVNWTVTVVERDAVNQGKNTTPTDCALFNPCPNPFNSISTIRYALPHPSDIRLTLIDYTGRMVREIAVGRHSAGYHSVSVDGSGLPNGVYVVRLETGKSALHKKIIVLK